MKIEFRLIRREKCLQGLSGLRCWSWYRSGLTDFTVCQDWCGIELPGLDFRIILSNKLPISLQRPKREITGVRTMAQEFPDIVFLCKKCGHNLYVAKSDLSVKLLSMIDRACPNCGEEGYCNWVLYREGNFEKRTLQRKA